MKLEIWMIVCVGVAFAVGFGAVTVLLLGLHSEVRRLSRIAENAQRALLANLRQTLPSVSVPSEPIRRSSSALPVHAPYAASPPPPPPATVTPPAEPEEETALPIATLSAATSEPDPSPEIEHPPEPEPESVNSLGWNPDRRLLVMRLASRGKTPDQIAAALRIPQEEVEQFLEVNKLVPKHQMD